MGGACSQKLKSRRGLTSSSGRFCIGWDAATLTQDPIGQQKPASPGLQLVGEIHYCWGGSNLGWVISAKRPRLKPFCRLLDVLDAPEDIPFLSNLIQREIVYRLLRGPHGERLRAIATLGDQSHRTAKAIAWLRANYTKPLRVEELAEIARMGMSTLHHHFRALTAMSPLQYQKQLRLVAARERMLVEGLDAASAAFEVGYESASQFNREYKRFFG